MTKLDPAKLALDLAAELDKLGDANPTYGARRAAVGPVRANVGRDIAEQCDGFVASVLSPVESGQHVGVSRKLAQ